MLPLPVISEQVSVTEELVYLLESLELSPLTVIQIHKWIE